jgi:hypothetical protein
MNATDKELADKKAAAEKTAAEGAHAAPDATKETEVSKTPVAESETPTV